MRYAIKAADVHARQHLREEFEQQIFSLIQSGSMQYDRLLYHFSIEWRDPIDSETYMYIDHVNIRRSNPGHPDQQITISVMTSDVLQSASNIINGVMNENAWECLR